MNLHAPEPSPRIEALVPAARGNSDRVRIRLDDGSSLAVAREVVSREGLSVGDPVDAELRAVLEDADLRWRAREAALQLLSHGPRTRRELARRLRRKDFPRGVIDPCLDVLEEEGLVDDAALARDWVRERLRRRPRGRRRLTAELRKKGVSSRVADEAVDEVFAKDEVSELELAQRAAMKWLDRQSAEVKRGLVAEPFSDERERARRRLSGYLGRRGFGGEVAIRAMEAARSAVSADDDTREEDVS